jgi:DNA-binding CsgD family transcriptional regulator
MMPLTARKFACGIAEMRAEGAFNANERKSSADKVCQAYDEGERNCKAIANRLGLAESTVRQYLRWNGRLLGKKTRNFSHSPRTLEIAEDLRDGGLTQYKIAKKYGVSAQYINKVKLKLEKGFLEDDQRKAD